MKQVIWVIVVLLVIWGVYALATKSSAPTETDMPAVAESAAPAAVNSLEVMDQKPGKEVLVSSWMLSTPGYAVVHKAAANDTPGDILGASDLWPAGAGTNGKIMLATALKDGDKIIVMLHLDTDMNGKLDGAIDMPATMATETGGQAVVMKMVWVKK
jgi:hypothetical protein